MKGKTELKSTALRQNKKKSEVPFAQSFTILLYYLFLVMHYFFLDKESEERISCIYLDFIIIDLFV